MDRAPVAPEQRPAATERLAASLEKRLATPKQRPGATERPLATPEQRRATPKQRLGIPEQPAGATIQVAAEMERAPLVY